MFRYRALFRQATKLGHKRNLYTDQIYPYPEKYANTVRYPSQAMYRETWKSPSWLKEDDKVAWFINTIFWATMTIFALNDGPNLLGHFDLPDPSIWTDEELGIPPE